MSGCLRGSPCDASPDASVKFEQGNLVGLACCSRPSCVQSLSERRAQNATLLIILFMLFDGVRTQ
jgi:hypothetical protein